MEIPNQHFVENERLWRHPLRKGFAKFAQLWPVNYGRLTMAGQLLTHGFETGSYLWSCGWLLKVGSFRICGKWRFWIRGLWRCNAKGCRVLLKRFEGWNPCWNVVRSWHIAKLTSKVVRSPLMIFETQCDIFAKQRGRPSVWRSTDDLKLRTWKWIWRQVMWRQAKLDRFRSH